jgi:uncharacterized protein with WD repeat
MENGYHMYDFKGNLLREESIDRFKQLVWRPRPPTLLSKEEQAEIRKNLRNYSKVFDEQDQAIPQTRRSSRRARGCCRSGLLGARVWCGCWRRRVRLSS